MLELETEIPEFSAIDIGFDVTEIDLAVGAAAEHAQEEEPVAAGPPVTQPGDIWKLGRHRVGHGDATSGADLLAVTEGHKIDMLSADPPYGCKVNGFVTTRLHREFVQASGEQSDEELGQLFSGSCAAALGVLKPGALAYIFID